MDILRCMGSKFCVKFQRAPMKFHTKFRTHTPQNMHSTVFNFCVWVTISLNCDVISLSETGPRWQWTRDIIVMSLLHENGGATSFWRNDDVIIALCVRYFSNHRLLYYHRVFHSYWYLKSISCRLTSMYSCIVITLIPLIFLLTHWGRDKMAAIFQTTFSNGFLWIKIHEFRLTFHWSLFLRLQLTIFQHWFR